MLLIFELLLILYQGSSYSGFSLINQVTSFLAITLSVFISRKLLDRRSIKSLGLPLNHQTMTDLLIGVVIGGLMMIMIFIIEWAAGWLHIDGFAWQTKSVKDLTLEMIVMLIFFTMVAWQEELAHRGYQLQNLEEGLNLPWGVFLSSAIFALLHLANPNVTFLGIVGIFISGLFLAYGYLATRQLWLPIGLHFGWNFFESSLLGFQVSGISELPRLILQSVQGNAIFTGGEFGPEGGLVLLPGILLGACLVYLYTRNRNLKNLKIDN